MNKLLKERNYDKFRRYRVEGQIKLTHTQAARISFN
jgi:hypothetical protein